MFVKILQLIRMVKFESFINAKSNVSGSSVKSSWFSYVFIITYEHE